MIIEERAKAYAGNKRRQLTTGQVVGFHVEDLEDILCQAYLQGAKDANGWVRCEDRLPEDDQQVYCRLKTACMKHLCGMRNIKYGKSSLDMTLPTIKRMFSPGSHSLSLTR